MGPWEVSPSSEYVHCCDSLLQNPQIGFSPVQRAFLRLRHAEHIYISHCVQIQRRFYNAPAIPTCLFDALDGSVIGFLSVGHDKKTLCWVLLTDEMRGRSVE